MVEFPFRRTGPSIDSGIFLKIVGVGLRVTVAEASEREHVLGSSKF
eukprot:SAG31_NODE_15183_length_766_cov_1.514243_1_plen_46_part_00